MDPPKQDGPNFPLSGGLIALAIAIIFYLTVETPFRAARPENPRLGIDKAQSAEDVQARLWEDPFAAVARHSPKGTASQRQHTDDHGHSIGDLTLQFEERSLRPGLVIMSVMVFGGPYPEDQEGRIRTRHAVLSALGRLEYAPRDENHIGYIQHQPCIATEATCLPEYIPYEWFISTDSQHSRPAVLVLWLDDKQFQAKPWQKLAYFVAKIKKRFSDKEVRFVVQGPAGSTVLRAMAKEEIDNTNNNIELNALKGVEIYSPKATVAENYLDVGGLLRDTFNELLIDDGRGGFYRTIGTDTALAKTLINEIKRRTPPSRRGVCPPHIALISEWDTFYGRTFPKAFRDELRRNIDYKNHCKKQIDNRLHRVTYLRGIDGQGPASALERKDQAGDTKHANRPDQSSIERPVGPGQFDYLRRLAESLERKNKELAQDSQHDGHERIAAIGVVGSDVYDKLLVLQALRDRFPNAIFFTTDLDANLMHPQELEWTRNLIVASHFGLELHPHWQEDVHPFRGSYQTAHFFATRLALDPAARQDHQASEGYDLQQEINLLLGEPRIFEIARSGAFDLSVNGERHATSGETANGSQCPIPIHPRRTDLVATGARQLMVLLGQLWLWVLTALLLMVTFVALYHRISTRRSIDHLLDAGFLLVAVLSGGLLSLMVVTQGEEGEPLAWFEGISIWPTSYMRLFAALLALYFVIRAWRNLSENVNNLDATYFQPRSYQADIQNETSQTAEQAVVVTDGGALRYWQHYRDRQVHGVALPRYRTGGKRTNLLGRIFWCEPRYRYSALPSEDAGDSEEQRLVRLWIDYHEQDLLRRRLRRVLLLTILFWLFASVTFASFGPVYTPARGDRSFEVHQIIIRYLAAPLLTFLIFWVVDATKRAVWLVKELCKNDMHWPEATREHFARRLNIDKKFLSPWINIQFIGEHTAVIHRLIYLPVVVILILILSRATYFDDWNFPLPLIIVLSLLFAYSIYNAIILRGAAEHARSAAIDRLHEDLIKAAGGRQEDDQRRAEQLKLLLDEVRGIRQGAFLPLPKQPWLRGILLLIGGSGSLAYLEYFVWSR